MQLECGEAERNEEYYLTLAHLPTLTKLDTSKGLMLQHADFLQHLPALASLALSFDEAANPVDTSRVMAALSTCSSLTQLTLDGSNYFGLTSEHLASALQHMPHLSSLVAMSACELHSLSFLSSGTLPMTLTSLEVGFTNSSIPLVELQRVHVLRSLRSLTFGIDTFDAPLDEVMRQLYTPPSSALPALMNFNIKPW